MRRPPTELPVIEERVPMHLHTTLELGGAAEFFCRVESEAALAAALAWAADQGVPARILGGGSNLVVGDDLLPGLVIQVAMRGVTWRDVDGDDIEAVARAGEPWDDFVAEAVSRGARGVAALSGIPGLVGATPIQNVGAYGQSVADTISGVRVLDRGDGKIRNFAPAECRFRYRHSHFKDVPGRYVVLAVTFRFATRGPSTVRYPELEQALEGEALGPATVRSKVLSLRRRKSMVLDPHDENRRSAGSFFLNPIVSREQAAHVRGAAVAQGWVKHAEDVPSYPEPDGRVKFPAAWLIERAGFPKGSREGAVGQSSRHALALVHHAGGSTDALLAYAARIRAAVAVATGLQLEQEPTSWGGNIVKPPR